jgi:hypothetical protein
MIDYIATNWFELLEIAGLVVAAASAIAAMTPTPKDDGVIKVIRKIVNALALNVGKAKSKDDA